MPQDERNAASISCSNTCPKGVFQDFLTCECGCKEIKCIEPQYLNPKTCKCDCKTSNTIQIKCLAPNFINPKTCKCETCKKTIKDCINLQNFNEKTCLCECEAQTWVKCKGFDPIACVCGQ